MKLAVSVSRIQIEFMTEILEKDTAFAPFEMVLKHYAGVRQKNVFLFLFGDRDRKCRAGSRYIRVTSHEQLRLAESSGFISQQPTA